MIIYYFQKYIMRNTIGIQNKLRVMEGNIILIPGCEPISVVTHISNYSVNPDATSLTNNFDEICSASYISLEAALNAIPDSYIIWSHDPNYRWYVLPSGPPPGDMCPCVTNPDWYDVLRENADPGISAPDSNLPECGDGLGFDWYKQ
jgi:hypothetical protein